MFVLNTDSGISFRAASAGSGPVARKRRMNWSATPEAISNASGVYPTSKY